MADHCDCGHEHCHELPKKATTYPLTMENLEKGVKNMNIIIDMIDTRQDDKREQMMIFLKIFFDDLVKRFKNKDKPEEPEPDKKEEEKKVTEFTIPIKVVTVGENIIKFSAKPSCTYGLNDVIDGTIQCVAESEKRKKLLEDINKRKEKIPLSYMQEALKEAGIPVQNDSDSDEEEEEDDGKDKDKNEKEENNEENKDENINKKAINNQDDI